MHSALFSIVLHHIKRCVWKMNNPVYMYSIYTCTGICRSTLPSNIIATVHNYTMLTSYTIIYKYLSHSLSLSLSLSLSHTCDGFTRCEWSGTRGNLVVRGWGSLSYRPAVTGGHGGARPIRCPPPVPTGVVNQSGQTQTPQ